MDLRQQVVRFRELLDRSGLEIDDFELNVNSDAFRKLLDGGAGSLEVLCRRSGIAINYQYDGTASWLDQLAADLSQGKFRKDG
ncbi:MAG: hypothetical protein C0623_11300 [Desulfuromonas sp.]|nr:MAG: hypothetical protein C0623_11300 [Desulfuromonas sp.]